MNKPTHSRYGLPFITDQAFRYFLKETIADLRHRILYKEFIRPVADAFKLELYGAAFGRTDREVVKHEELRRIEKTNNNAVGLFHQNIFRHAPDPWYIPDQGQGCGFDLINEQEHIYVEIKNGTQHNSSELAGLWLRMARMLDMDPEAQCYLVEVLSSQRGVRPFHFAPSSRAKHTLSGLAEENMRYAVRNMPDLLEAFDDHDANFYNAYEHRYDEPDYEDEGAETQLGSTNDVDRETLSDVERQQLDHIHRASIDWLYGKVFGQESYFYDMLEAIPLALSDIVAQCGTNGEAINTVESGLEAMGVDLDSDEPELYWHLLGTIYEEMRRRNKLRAERQE